MMRADFGTCSRLRICSSCRNVSSSSSNRYSSSINTIDYISFVGKNKRTRIRSNIRGLFGSTAPSISSSSSSSLLPSLSSSSSSSSKTTIRPCLFSPQQHHHNSNPQQIDKRRFFSHGMWSRMMGEIDDEDDNLLDQHQNLWASPSNVEMAATEVVTPTAAAVVDTPSILSQLPCQRNKGIMVSDFTLDGISVGGQETCILSQDFKISFDIGRCPHRAVHFDHVFITHGHIDHIGGLPFHCATRGLMNLTPPTYVLPKQILPTVEKLLEYFGKLNKSPLSYSLVGLRPGEEYMLPKQNAVVRPFPTHHSVPSQGYLISLHKRKLRNEFLDLPGHKIQELRQNGADIFRVEEKPQIAFTGDTKISFLLDEANAEVRKAKLLIMECTFIDDRITPKAAHAYGHTHVDHVCRYADLIEAEHVLFNHFSSRYRTSEILDFTASRLDETSLKGRYSLFLHNFTNAT